MEKQKLLTQNRITVIDALRGFALLGVVLVHMNQRYSNFAWGLPPREPVFSGLDQFVGWLVQNVLMFQLLLKKLQNQNLYQKSHLLIPE